MDFANVTAYPPRQYSGILVLRLPRQDKATVLAALSRAIPLLPEEDLGGQLWIVEASRVRVHSEEPE